MFEVETKYVRRSRKGRPIFTVLFHKNEVLPSIKWPLTWRDARDLEDRLRTLHVRRCHDPMEVVKWAAYRWAGYGLHTLAAWRRKESGRGAALP